ncbi:neural cell adhesion molecule 1 isoform X2 [Genypterus blacodes]|uniref:neural cell adhesion molecule 1 isoform X2 n=1 Tax=Genypterus blacodes TaxID=154954 RepID=UPI003F76DD8C
MDQSPSILRTTLLLLLLVFGTDSAMELISNKRDVLVGDEHILYCKAGVEGRITWQKDMEDIDEDMVSWVDESSSKFIIDKAKMDDAGRYTCRCDFGTHNDEITYELFVYEGPSFGTTVTYHEFLEGTNGTLPCLVSGQPAVDVQWLRNQQKIPSYGRTSTQSLGLTYEGKHVRQLPDNTLIIEQVSRKDAGTYVCKAVIRGRPVSQEIAISVVINAPPTVHAREEVKKVMAGQDNNISLLCLVDGVPKPNITWIMPVKLDPLHHQFNSDRSLLTILSVAKEDFGDYVCKATNKIAESSAAITLHVFETPEVFVAEELRRVLVGESVSVSCNVSGHPQPELHWLNKHNGRRIDYTSDRVRILNDALVIDYVVPSDGGVYSCMAVTPFGNASRDFIIHTQPGPPQYLSVSPGPTSVFFSLKTLPVDGGTPITSFALQWRQRPAEVWQESTVPASVPIAITSLKPYTLYTVRLAAMNAVGRGQFSETHTARTHGIRGEPDSPVLSTYQMKVDSNTFSIPLKQSDDGGTPLLHFNIRYKQDKEGAEWNEKQLSSDADIALIPELLFGTDYQLEVMAVNLNGSSIPSTINFTIPQQSVKMTTGKMTKGAVVGIVMMIFLLVLVAVDAACCYTKRCGLLMFISMKLFGHEVPGLKMSEEGDGATNGDLKLKGIGTPRGSIQQQMGVQNFTKEGGQLTEVTCDKAPLTKNEKAAANRDLPTTDA